MRGDFGLGPSVPPSTHTLDEGKHSINDVSEYEGYVIRVDHPPKHRMDNPVRDSLKQNTETVSTLLGPNHVYVKLLSEDANTAIIRRVEQNALDELLRDGESEYSSFDHTLPWVVIVDKHPANIDPDDRCVIIELGTLDSEMEVTNNLTQIAKYVRSDEFKKLSWDDRLNKLRSKTPDSLSIVGVAASAAGLV